MGSAAHTARLLVWSTALLGSGTAACIVPCNEIACDGGFEWTATPADGSTIAPGQYRLELVIEGTTHVVECAIAAGLRDSECGEPVVTDGKELFVWAHLDSRQSSATWDPEAPIEALRVSIADHGDWDDDDRSQSVRGPEKVAITLSLGDRVLLEDEFAPQYERDEDFWGDKRCGYCDEREDGSSQWVP